ncbi:MAG: PAS-domain containing protein [Rhizobiaceae bacterium]|nr:PAS-domain containing protein [Rhizobiaceae bacterium]
MPGDTPRQAGKVDSGRKTDSGQGKPDATEPRFSRLGRFALASVSGTALLAAGPALAQDRLAATLFSFGTFEVIQFSMLAGVMGAALLSAIVLIRERARTAAENVTLRARVADLNGEIRRSEALLGLRDQRLIVWNDEHRKPELLGSLPSESGAPDERASFLAFGRWLTARSAAALENAVASLRERGAAFDLVIEAQNGAPIEVQGRRTAAHVIVRFLSLSDSQRQQARLKLENQQLSAEQVTILGLIEALETPFWVRSKDGQLKWVNGAYARAVEAADRETAIRESRELLGTQAREAIEKQHQTNPVFTQSLSTVVAGDRHVFAVTDFSGAEGSAGIAVDKSEIDTIRAEYERTVRSHADTLDRLTTAVAIFDADQKLRFFNQAFQKLWELDLAFLTSAPDNALFVDRLRSEGKIAEQPEWRRWKENLLSTYRSVDPQEHLWHLPDGRTIRVVANPQPKGGVTWIFENLTEKIDLESRYATAVRVQGETLDNLAEGVAVFGPDGRIRLSNPAFNALWSLSDDVVVQKMHISAIRLRCDPLAKDSPWPGFVAAVTGFDEERLNRDGHAELLNGTVLRYGVSHLPNGHVMITFVDVTDSVNVERALKEKNDALEKADRLKNDFVQHISYELRSPLTNIIGFTELLSLPETGPLQPKQREYVEHIGISSSVLLTIVNDILDLATVDAGIMQLDIAEVDVRKTITAAADLVADRLQEHSISLKLETAFAPDIMLGDEIRIRQILYNLLGNATNYAPEGSIIKLACRQLEIGTEFSVHDDGPGIPPDVLDTVFGRFESRANGGRRRGAGLGLSIVKSFVELHGGTVRIDTAPEQGTTVSCLFPINPAGMRDAAE